MKYLEITSYGQVYNDCHFKLSHYTSNNNLAVGIWSKSEGPFATLTVNIAALNKNEAAIDVNNCKFAEDLIKSYGFGEIIGYVKSGYVDYPIYKLDVSKMLEYGMTID